MADCKNLQNIRSERNNKFSKNFNLYGIARKIRSDKGGAFISNDYIESCKSNNIEIEYCTSRIHTDTKAIERAVQTIENLTVANLEDIYVWPNALIER